MFELEVVSGVLSPLPMTTWVHYKNQFCLLKDSTKLPSSFIPFHFINRSVSVLHCFNIYKFETPQQIFVAKISKNYGRYLTTPEQIDLYLSDFAFSGY